VETSVLLLMCRSYPLSVESAYHRRRISTVTRAFLAVGYAIFARLGERSFQDVECINLHPMCRNPADGIMQDVDPLEKKRVGNL